MSFAEFVALAAAIMSTQAIAMDAMLPALPTIIRSLHVSSENYGQWVVITYLIGVGIGQLFCGMLSDRYGRRPVLLGGLAIYIVAVILSAFAASFPAFLAWRFVHGLAGASAVVTRSVIRDLHSGRQMARVMSLTFIVLLIVPVIAPSLGQGILLLAPWRYIFFGIGAFATIIWVWALLRLPETLHPEYRMTLTRAHIGAAVLLVVRKPMSLWYTLAITVITGTLVAYIGMVQQIFADIFHRASLMPVMFAASAAAMAATSFLNSRIVERLGMRRISHTALLLFIAVALLHVIVVAFGLERVWTFVLLQAGTMMCFSLAASNFGAIAMEPLGSIAGIGASLQGFVTTFAGAVVGAAIGRQFNGSILPLVSSSLCCGILSLLFVLVAEKGRLFRPQHATDEPLASRSNRQERRQPSVTEQP